MLHEVGAVRCRCGAIRYGSVKDPCPVCAAASKVSRFASIGVQSAGCSGSETYRLPVPSAGRRRHDARRFGGRLSGWLYLPDPGPLIVTLAAYVANRLPGDPVWLLLVGPPSSGKTELLNALSGLKDTYSVSTFTEAGLLSGSTSRRPDATGGLLAELGRFGNIVCKDFGSVLSESAETRAGLLAALREIYDGAWCRRVGTGGGLTLAWTGKAGLVAGVTETIDRHSATMGALGERFLLYRMPALDDEGRLEQGRRAAANAGRQGDAPGACGRSDEFRRRAIAPPDGQTNLQ